MVEKGTKTLNDDWKGTKRPETYFIISSIRNIIGQEGTFMDEKGTTLLLGMIEKNKNAWNLKQKEHYWAKYETLMDEKGTKTLCKEWLKRNKRAVRLKPKLMSLLLVFVLFAK